MTKSLTIRRAVPLLTKYELRDAIALYSVPVIGIVIVTIVQWLEDQSVDGSFYCVCKSDLTDMIMWCSLAGIIPCIYLVLTLFSSGMKKDVVDWEAALPYSSKTVFIRKAIPVFLLPFIMVILGCIVMISSAVVLDTITANDMHETFSEFWVSFEDRPHFSYADGVLVCLTDVPYVMLSCAAAGSMCLLSSVCCGNSKLSVGMSIILLMLSFRLIEFPYTIFVDCDAVVTSVLCITAAYCVYRKEPQNIGLPYTSDSARIIIVCAVIIRAALLGFYSVFPWNFYYDNHKGDILAHYLLPAAIGLVVAIGLGSLGKNGFKKMVKGVKIYLVIAALICVGAILLAVI